MVAEVVKVFHHDLLKHVQVRYQNVCLCTDVEPEVNEMKHGMWNKCGTVNNCHKFNFSVANLPLNNHTS